MKAKDYYSSFYEKKQDERLENSIETFNSMFKQDSKDPLEDTKDIKGYELVELKELLAKRYNRSDDSSDNKESKGKVLKKKLPGSSISEDVSEIGSAFLSCFVLALVTAFIGAGWLIYIINHI